MGNEDHVRGLFGDRVESLELRRQTYVERSVSPEAYLELFRTTFGPLIALRTALADDPERAHALGRRTTALLARRR